MRFAKYHGIGNDFVMLADPRNELKLTPRLVRRLCDRRFGVGADGVIRVAPGDDGAELFMDYVNSDGSVGEMCGNGIRCLARFALAEGLSGSRRMKVGTRAGLKEVEVVDDELVRVDMGAPVFLPPEIPVRWDGPEALHVKLELEGAAGVAYRGPQVVEAACLSMGNPHAVLFVDDLGEIRPTELGPSIEHHRLFPNRTNVEFVKVSSPERLEVKVWERGSGETLACGTGACAAAVTARLLAGASPRVVVALPGGELTIEWSGSLHEQAPVLMTGPAEESFTGDIEIEGR